MTSPETILRARFKLRQGALALDVDFALTQPWTILFGPSGSGKTTILRSISGFVRPNAGSIATGAGSHFDSDAKINMPAYMRPVRSAAQDARLFPHITVRSNIGYGVGPLVDPGEVNEIVDEVMQLFRLGALGHKLPRELSGGESQRASVARAALSAITCRRSMLLLDEPFTGLDAPIRDELIATVPAWLRKRSTPVLSVTHDVAEAFQLNAEVIKIADGKIVEQGPVSVVLAEERMRLVAQLNGPESPA